MFKDEIQPVKIRLIGVSRGIGIGLERRRTTGTKILLELDFLWKQGWELFTYNIY